MPKNMHTVMDASLPSRERGLKSQDVFDDAAELTSLPSRERGLKFNSI